MKFAMFYIRLCMMLLALALSACSSEVMRSDTNELDTVRNSLTNTLNKSADLYIVAAVDNPRASVSSHAGSTPRAYDGAASYQSSLIAKQMMRSIATAYGLREVTSWPIEPLQMHCAVLEIPANSDRSSILASLAHDPRVKLAQPLQTFTTRGQTYNDPYVGLQQGFRMMDVPDAHQWSRGEGVRIAVIDTGADIAHPDLRGRVAVAKNFVDADAQQFRRDIHGTEVAGVIAALANNHAGIVGISPDAQLMVFKACWQLAPDADAAQCNSLTLAKALVAALDARAQIVNLSLAGPDDLLLRSLIDAGVRRGILFVGAAPAGDANTGDRFLKQPGVITVASAEEPHVSNTAIYAPGREILTLLPDGHYGFASGSSLATAHITGTVALLLAKHPSLTSAMAHQVLSNATTSVASTNGMIDSVDACDAVITLLGKGVCDHAASPGSDTSRHVDNHVVIRAASQAK